MDLDRVLVEEFTTPYAGTDLKDIKPLPISKIKGPKDLEREAKVVFDVLIDKSKYSRILT